MKNILYTHILSLSHTFSMSHTFSPPHAHTYIYIHTCNITYIYYTVIPTFKLMELERGHSATHSTLLLPVLVRMKRRLFLHSNAVIRSSVEGMNT